MVPPRTKSMGSAVVYRRGLLVRPEHRDGACRRRARVVPHPRLLERGAGRVLWDAVDLVRRLEARGDRARSAGACVALCDEDVSAAAHADAAVLVAAMP